MGRSNPRSRRANASALQAKPVGWVERSETHRRGGGISERCWVSRSLSSGRPLRAGPVGSTHPTGWESRSFGNLVFETQAVTEGVDRVHHLGAIGCDVEAGAVVFIILAEKFGVELLNARRSDQGRAAGRRVAMMLAQMQRQAVARKLHVKRGAFKNVTFPIDRKAEEIDVEFLRLADVEHANDRDCGKKLDARAGFWTRSGIGQLGCQDVSVVEAELLGDEFQALGH